MKSFGEIVIKEEFLEKIEAIFRDSEEKNDAKSLEILANIIELISKKLEKTRKIHIFPL